MALTEERSLLRENKLKLSIAFATICILDVFGVLPVITLPIAVLDCGYYGILIIFVVCGTQTYTAILLGKCWLIAEKIDEKIVEKNRYPYSALAELCFGRFCSNCVSFLVDITIFCGGIPNLIVASQLLEMLSKSHVSYCYWIIMIGIILCPVFWLGSPKDINFSVVIVIAVFLIVTINLIMMKTSNLEMVASNFSWELIFICYGIVSFQFDIHPTLLTIQVDMRRKSRLNIAVFVAFIISILMVGVVTLTVAIKIQNLTQPSILEVLPIGPSTYLAAFLVAVQLCITLAVSNCALFQHMEDCMDIPREFTHRRCVLRTTLSLMAIVIAESVPRFDLVMSLIGATLTGPLVFIFPTLFYLKLCITKTICEITICITIISLSTIATIASTYINLKYALNYSNFTQPCIFNVTAELINY